MKKKIIRSLGPLLGLVLFTIALFVLHRELKNYSYHDVIRSLGELPTVRIYIALALTILNYLVMTGYDSLALRYTRNPLAYRKIALASFIGYAFSMNIGLSMIAGSSVRYRLYSAWGLSAIDITKVVAFYTLALWLGLGTVAGLMFLIEPLAIPSLLHLPFSSIQPFGILFLILVGGYLSLCTLRKRPLRIREWEFSLPSVRLSLYQITVASLDWALAGGVLYVLLPASTILSYPAFLSIFLLAQIVGMLSQIPGGLGIFDTMILTLLGPMLPIHLILGSLLVYRATYYLLPLVMATMLLGVHEIFQRKAEVKRAALIIGQWIPVLLPNVFALAIFVSGAVLLFSGALPAVHWHLRWLKDFIPVPVIEISHFLASLVGVGLLFLARGLQRRLDGAYLLALTFIAWGIVLSLLKGFDYKEALALLVMFSVLLPSRRHFYRKASLISQRFTPGWIAAIMLVLLCSVWLGMFSHKNVAYSNELWWQFTLYGDAPRFFRASVGAICVALFLAIASLLRPARLGPALPGKAEMERARAVLKASRRIYSNLALLGDKALLFSENETAFIMYGIEGRSWIAFGDPIGPEEEWAELAWRFHEMCDRHDGWTVFYEVGRGDLHLYLDLGLGLLKIGEEARIPLENFSLEGSNRRGLRRFHHKVEKEGCIFKIILPADIPSILPDLKTISDAWLAEKKTEEKRFSIGFFNEEYLKQFPVGIVQKGNEIIAFANILSGAQKEELSADLMRHLPESPNGTMDYLFIELMLWGKKEGYRWFNLGMAPLSGLENHTLAPLWNRLGTFIFHHGDHFYSFQGLRQYKEKFNPEWEPRYLASPGGLALPRTLLNIASLISGGLKGLVGK
jgi:phosphatidylglycerol lysyltransferase